MSTMCPSALVGAQNRLLVLGFHNIERTWCWPAAAGTGVRTFTQHLQILRRVANVVDLREALDALRSGQKLPPRAVALTFDDGYRDNLTLAAPLLRRLSMPATVFLVPGLLDRTVHAWWERLGWAITEATVPSLSYDGVDYPLADTTARIAAQRAVEEDIKTLTHTERAALIEDFVERLQPRGSFDADDLFLDWDAAATLPDAGLTVGSHTMEHPILSRESAGDQQFSLRESKRLLQDRIGVEVPILAYPNGTRNDYDTTTLTEVEAAGYEYAVTTWGGVTTTDVARYEVHRALVGPYTHPARFAAFLGKRLLAA